MKCPKCGSENTQYVANTISKGPSFFKGCCGWIILGPVGLLFSLCGTGSELKEYWICNACGAKFQAGDYEANLEKKNKKILRLKQKSAELEDSLRNRTENLEERYKKAAEEYNAAKDNYEQFEKAFYNTSGLLKVLNVLYYLLPVLAFLLTVICGFSLLSVGEFWKFLVIAAVGIAITWGLVVLMDFVIRVSRKKTDPVRAAEIERLENIYKEKEKPYQNLKKTKENVKLYKRTVEELNEAEKDRDSYRKSGD